jgi:oligosaccharide repeat unit polymerase
MSEMVIPGLVIVVGLVACVIAWRKVKNLWFRLVTLLVIGRGIIDAGLAPIVTAIDIFGVTDYYNGILVPRVMPQEVPTAAGWLVLHYGSIVAGLVLVAGVMKRETDTCPQVSPLSLPESLRRQAFNASLVVFGIGLLARLITLGFLLQSRSLFSIAGARAVYTDELAVSSPLYNYASSFASFADVGVLGLLILGRSLRPGVVAVLSDVIFAILLGGRAQAAISILSAVMVYALGQSLSGRGQWIKLRSLIIAASGAAIVLAATASSRFETGPVSVRTIGYFLFARRLDQMAFVTRVFPGQLSYLNGASLLSGFAQIVPGFDVPGAINLWRYLMVIYVPGVQFVGYGGGNLAAAAEHYSNFGPLGVPLVALAYGLFCGAMIYWCWSRRHSPFFLILYVALFWRIFGAAESRTVHAVAGMLFGTILPLSFMAFFALRDPRRTTFFLITMIFAVAFFFAWRLSGLWWLLGYAKYLSVALIGLAYVLGVRMLNAVADEQGQVSEQYQHGQNKEARSLWPPLRIRGDPRRRGDRLRY